MCTYEKLINDLKKAGIEKGIVLLVHSSFKALECKGLTPLLVINAIKEILTDEGTLLIPTLSYKTVTKENPYFSYHDTPSCVGIISEIFRKEKDTIRSINPIHSVAAWGKHAIELTNEHIKDRVTIFYYSPLYKMLKYNAKILMLGCGLKPNTFMHLVENINHLHYRNTVYRIDFKITNQDGNTFSQVGELPDMSNYLQRYDRIEKILSVNDLQESKVLNATTYLIDANQLMQKASEVLKTNPLYFVDEIKK